MSDKPDNPLAFPAIVDESNVLQWGMTLRDFFAAAALQGLLANPKMHKEIMKQGQTWIERQCFRLGQCHARSETPQLTDEE